MILRVAQLVKNPPAMWETWVQSLGWEDPLEKGMTTHSTQRPFSRPGGKIRRQDGQGQDAQSKDPRMGTTWGLVSGYSVLLCTTFVLLLGGYRRVWAGVCQLLLQAALETVGWRKISRKPESQVRRGYGPGLLDP